MFVRLLIVALLAICPLSFAAAQAPTGDMPFDYLSTASTNATVVKASGGSITNIVAVNTTATIYYLKFYNKATAPTCNSDTVIWTVPLLVATVGPTIIQMPSGMIFRTGIGFCITGGIAANDNTNAATGVAVNLTVR